MYKILKIFQNIIVMIFKTYSLDIYIEKNYFGFQTLLILCHSFLFSVIILIFIKIFKL